MTPEQAKELAIQRLTAWAEDEERMAINDRQIKESAAEVRLHRVTRYRWLVAVLREQEIGKQTEATGTAS